MRVPRWLNARLVWLFLLALWRHWKAALMGGTITAVVAVFVFATVRPVVQPWGWVVLAATFLSASFAAWKEEHNQVIQLQARVPLLPSGDVRVGYIADARKMSDRLRALMAEMRPEPIDFEWQVAEATTVEDVQLKDAKLSRWRRMQMDTARERALRKYETELEGPAAVICANLISRIPVPPERPQAIYGHPGGWFGLGYIADDLLILADALEQRMSAGLD